jgi:hypothetical protein
MIIPAHGLPESASSRSKQIPARSKSLDAARHRVYSADAGDQQEKSSQSTPRRRSRSMAIRATCPLPFTDIVLGFFLRRA